MQIVNSVLFKSLWFICTKTIEYVRCHKIDVCFITGTLKWRDQITPPSYIQGGITYDRCSGRARVPQDGMYGVYSYVQFDAYSVEPSLLLKEDKLIYHILYNSGTQTNIKFNRFPLLKQTFTVSQIGPVIVPLRANDTIEVRTSGEEWIQGSQSVFGIYKLG